jgi:GTP-binding protein LepA
MLRYRLPSAEIAADFSDELKSRTSGYATFDFDDAGYEPSDIVRLDVLVNGEAVDALSSLTHREKATRRGRDMCARLKEALPRQVLPYVFFLFFHPSLIGFNVRSLLPSSFDR